MVRTTLSIAVLCLAVLTISCPALAKGGPPAHADAADGPPGGPPAHASSEGGLPDHARANGHGDARAAADGDADAEPPDDEGASSSGEASSTGTEGETDATSEENEETRTRETESSTGDEQAGETRASPDPSSPTRDGTDGDRGTATAAASSDEPASESPTPTGASTDDTGEATGEDAPDHETEDPARAHGRVGDARTGGQSGTVLAPTAAQSLQSDPGAADAGARAPPSGVGSTALVLGPAAVLGMLGLGLVARTGPAAERDPDETGPAATVASEDAGEDEDAEETAKAGWQPPEAGVVGLLSLGRDALDRGEVERAAEWFATAALADPGRQVAHFCLGLCMAELDRLEEAEAALAEARRLQPGDPEAAYGHALVLARRGRNAEALGILERLADETAGMAERLRDEEDLAGLRDHPRLLALTGELDADGGMDAPFGPDAA